MIKVNGEDINVTKFPDGTSQVWHLPESILTAPKFDITWEFENEGEMFHLQQLVRLIRTGRVPCKMTLHMPFLPYGRQDKHISNNTTFAFQVFAGNINRLRFDRVSTVGGHSNMPRELINNYESYSVDKIIRNVHKNLVSYTDTNPTVLNNLTLAYPDIGAANRYRGGDIFGEKVRDQDTGYITEYKIKGDPKGLDILIVDDICDGGMTFKLMAEELIKQGANNVHLYVSHGIFSKGLKPLKDSGIQRIFTKDGEVIENKNNGYCIKEL